MRVEADASATTEATPPHPARIHSGRHRQRRGQHPRRRDYLEPIWLLAPAALTVLLAFQSGGFFAGSPGLVATILAGLLVLRITLGEHPFHGLGVAAGVAIGAFALLAVWTLLSQHWSHSPSRALLEFDRTLMYLLALALFATFRRDPKRIRWQVRALALGIAIVAGLALSTRLLPHLLSIAPTPYVDRLSYPLTYWNALGSFTAIGLLLCFHMTSDAREPAAVRVLSAAATPILATTIFFTFSRGAIAAGTVGLIVYTIVARPRGLLSGIASVVPTGAGAVVAAYGADLLAGTRLMTPDALSQGRHVALIVGLCVVGAGVLRVLLLPLDAWASELRLDGRARVGSRVGVAGIVVGLVALALALNAPAQISHQFHRFVHGNGVQTRTDLRQRLTDPSNNGRIPAWKVAIHEWRRHPAGGGGAGTYENVWAKHRPDNQHLIHAHSLYAQILGELGLVGALLLVVVLVSILLAFARRARGPNRALYSALLAAGVAWALHAGFDWDWEMPAVTLWLFALGGGALASRRRRRHAALPAPGRLPRVAIALGVVLLALVPVGIAVSQARLNESVAALTSHDCGRAIKRALASISVLSVRPEPFEVLGICDARLGEGTLGIQAMDAAVARDPDSWLVRYELALVRGAAGHDPRAAARAASQLNPRNKFVRQARDRFDATRDPRRWRAIAITQFLPIG